jgi:hypothetical protein
MPSPSEGDADHPAAAEDGRIQTKEKQSKATTFAPSVLLFALYALTIMISFFAVSPAPFRAAGVTPLENQLLSPSAAPPASPSGASSPAIHESSPTETYIAGTADQPGSTLHTSSNGSAGQKGRAGELSSGFDWRRQRQGGGGSDGRQQRRAALAVVDPARDSPEKGFVTDAAARASGNGSAPALAAPPAPAPAPARLLSQLTPMLSRLTRMMSLLTRNCSALALAARIIGCAVAAAALESALLLLL